ncbi:type II secretion system protein GspM [Frateuria aurantia]
MRRLRPWPATSGLWLMVVAMGLVGLIYLLLLRTWLIAPWRNDTSEMRSLRQLHARQAAHLALQPALRRQLAMRSHDPAESADFLPDDDAGAAAADLMQRVVASVARHGGPEDCEVTQKIPSARATSHDTAVSEVAVTIGLRCDPASLSAVLYDLEYGHPYIQVSQFAIYRDARASVAASGGRMEAQFVVSGFVKGLSPGATDDDAGVAEP